MQKVIHDNGATWTLSSVKREIAVYQEHLAKAKREIAAGNERMRAYAEAYAQHLDALIQLKAKFDA
ncbi:MAG TPA: hypothetical protein PKV98_16270 [Burkholderiaceae bacterium]|nr:hypothetical protein [Burkholderiaceae bacterium]